jgi:hypothetical protein
LRVITQRIENYSTAILRLYEVQQLAHGSLKYSSTSQYESFLQWSAILKNCYAEVNILSASSRKLIMEQTQLISSVKQMKQVVNELTSMCTWGDRNRFPVASHSEINPSIFVRSRQLKSSFINLTSPYNYPPTRSQEDVALFGIDISRPVTCALEACRSECRMMRSSILSRNLERRHPQPHIKLPLSSMLFDSVNQVDN